MPNGELKTRKCKICNRNSSVAPGSDGKLPFVQLLSKRFKTLKKWYPVNIKSANQYVHRSCLVSLGLDPMPDNEMPLDLAMGRAVTDRIAAIAAAHPALRAPNALIGCVFNIVRTEYRIPTAEGVRTLRWMVAHFVTTKLADGRGNIPSIGDTVAAIEPDPPIDITGGLFANVIACPRAAESPPVNGGPSNRMAVETALAAVDLERIRAIDGVYRSLIGLQMGPGGRSPRDPRIATPRNIGGGA